MTREEATIQSLMGHIEALEETIKTLQKETKWIPVSEQPKEYGEYLVSWMPTRNPSMRDELHGRCLVGFCVFEPDCTPGVWYTENMPEYGRYGVEIFAWMPLPEPYMLPHTIIKESEV